ncbi:hypothetical protein L7F22_012371 [Adiantum nelumboides]|nr:hypothetical protein [Adiantum nelumboides]
MPVRLHRAITLEQSNVQIPLYFRCPISLELMQDPVILSTGQTYDRSSIEKWVASGNTTCPVSMQKLEDFSLIPNHTLRRLIQEWCVANRSRGVQRIPTPTQPADPNRLRSLLSEASSLGADEEPTRVFAFRALKNLVKDSDSSKALLVEEGVIPILVSAFFGGEGVETGMTRGIEEAKIPHASEGETHEAAGGFSGCEMAVGEDAEEALGVLVNVPLSDIDKLSMTRPERLALIANVLQWGSAEARANAALLVETMSESKACRLILATSDSIVEGLVGLVGDSREASARSAGARALYMLCLRQAGRERAIEAGAASALVELLLLTEAEVTPNYQGVVERAVATLELLCMSENGCADVARQGAKAVAALMKSILKVSDRATEATASSLLAICSCSQHVQRCAIQVGVIKELLLLMQSDGSERAKGKAMKLLKLLRTSASLNSASVAEYGRSGVVPF